MNEQYSTVYSNKKNPSNSLTPQVQENKKCNEVSKGDRNAKENNKQLCGSYEKGNKLNKK